MRKLEKHTKAIAKKLNTLAAMGMGKRHEVFHAFVQTIFNQIAEPFFLSAALPFGSLHVMDGWRRPLPSYASNPAAWSLLAEIGKEYVCAVHTAQPFCDVVGAIYSEYTDPALGQFFSPEDVASLTAAITMQLLPPITTPFAIADPAGCGAGSLILSQLQEIDARQGAKALALTDVAVTDIDSDCVKLCCMQIMMSSIVHQRPLHSLTATHGNTLLMLDDRHVAYRFLSLNARTAQLAMQAATSAPEPAEAAAPTALTPQESSTARDALFDRVMGKETA